MSAPACPGANAVTVRVGYCLEATVVWTNVGTQTASYIVWVTMGDYIDTGNPINDLQNYLANALNLGSKTESSVPSQGQRTTTITSNPFQSALVRTQPYDIVILITDTQPDASGQLPIYGYCVAGDVVTVTS